MLVFIRQFHHSVFLKYFPLNNIQHTNKRCLLCVKYYARFMGKQIGNLSLRELQNVYACMSVYLCLCMCMCLCVFVCLSLCAPMFVCVSV